MPFKEKVSVSCVDSVSSYAWRPIPGRRRRAGELAFLRLFIYSQYCDWEAIGRVVRTEFSKRMLKL